MKAIKFIILLCITLCVFNCSNDSEDDLVNVDPPKEEEPGEETAINYVDDIASIVNSACIGCHASPPRNGAPFSLVNFSQVSQRASGSLSRMSLSSGSPGAMPPSGRLPQATIDLMQQWIDDGKKEN